jgi:hypothetical protein
MNKLYVFACSYGKHGTMVDNKWVDDNSFGDNLAKKFNMEFKNFSVVGACNYTILKQLTNVCKSIQDDDMVIVQWTFMHRAWSRYNYTIMPSVENEMSEVYYKNFYSEQQNLLTMVSYNSYARSLVNCKYYYSISDNLNDIKSISKNIYYDLLDDISFVKVTDGKTYVSPITVVKKIPDYVYSCFHPNIKGHDILANLYCQYMNSN